MTDRVQVYIGLGSNLGDSIVTLDSAVQALDDLPQSHLVKCSSFYRSRPLAGKQQPDYVNAVAMLETSLPPESLLDRLQSIEYSYGRIRTAEAWQSRTLDLDILLYGDRQIHSDRLTVPHPGISQRDFVVFPLVEIAPQLIVPGYGSIRELLQQTQNRGLEIIAR